jgi:Sugar-transfer associated ATP-grasp
MTLYDDAVYGFRSARNLMSVNLMSAAKQIIKYAIDLRNHRSSVREANRFLKNVEDRMGKTPSRDIELSDQYAVDVLGHKHFAPWLYLYSAISGGFKEGWIPDNFYASAVVPFYNGLYRTLAGLKSLNTVLFAGDAFPDIGSFVNGIFIDKAQNLVAPKDVRDLLFRDQDRVVFKLDRSYQGMGIYFFTRDTFTVDEVMSLGNGLFQGFIRQHRLFNHFAENSVATLRITTVFEDDGEASVRACYLRLGSGEDTHVQSHSHVRIPINLQSGAFGDKAYLTSWLTTSVHPTSKAPFAGNFVPAFSRCIATVTDLHKKVPYVRCIGWDIAVDVDENVKVMEWNARHPDIRFSEATQGPCFKDLGWERLKRRQILDIPSYLHIPGWV